MVNPTDLIRKSIKHNKNNRSLLRKKFEKTPEFPCGICEYDVKHNDKSILCSGCNKWVHIRCTEVSVDQYRDMQQRNLDNPDLIESEFWTCLKCVMAERSLFTPFITISSNTLSNLNSVDTMKMHDLLPDDNVFTDALKMNSLNYDVGEIDEGFIDNIECKYFTCDEFFNHDNSNSINILHSNVNGYLTHEDNINEFIAHDMKTTFDVICITETSLSSNNTVIPDGVLPEVYEPFSTGTLSTKGGASIFVKDTYMITLREMI